MRQHLIHGVGDIQRVGGGLLDNAKYNGAFSIKAGNASFILRAYFHFGHIAEANGIAFQIFQNDPPELLWCNKTCTGKNGKFPVITFDPSRRDLDILLTKGILHIGDGQIESGEPGAVQPDPHGVSSFPEDTNLRNAGDILKLIADVTVRIVGNFNGAVAITGKGNINNGLRVCLDLGDDRLFDFGGQSPADAGDAVPHIACRDIGVGSETEADGNAALFGFTAGGKDFNPLDPGDGAFQYLRYLAFDDFGAGAKIVRADGNNGFINIRIFANRQTAIGHDANHDDNETHHRGKDRTADEELKESHVRLPVRG